MGIVLKNFRTVQKTISRNATSNSRTEIEMNRLLERIKQLEARVAILESRP